MISATDNQAYLALTDLPPVRILYVGPGNPLFESTPALFHQRSVDPRGAMGSRGRASGAAL